MQIRDGYRGRMTMQVGLLRLGMVAAIALAISGCSMGGMFKGNKTAEQYANTSATPAEMAAVDPLPAIATECPEIKVRPGADAIFYYGNGQTGNARDLHYQASF